MDKKSVNTSVNNHKSKALRRRRSRQVDGKGTMEVEGLFRQSDSDDEEDRRSQARSQTKNRKKTRLVSQRRNRAIEQENENLRKAMNQMQDRYNDMLLRQATEKIKATPNPTTPDLKGNALLVHANSTDVGLELRKSLDENLLDDGIGTNDQAIIEKLMSMDDLEAATEGVKLKAKGGSVVPNLQLETPTVDQDSKPEHNLTNTDFTFRGV